MTAPESAAATPAAAPAAAPLRRGWTTGACATAAARSACAALLGQGFLDPVTIRLPRGQEASFTLAERHLGAGVAMAAIVKDAGDDPDVTHGCLVRASLRRNPAGAGITFHAGEGVGTITRAGLQLPPGEAAINPVPRRMMQDAVSGIAAEAGAPADIAITVSIPGGEALAARTLNPRLGILGGLSILGTTGVVVPFSCAAWIHSIHRGIDVARAAGLDHLGAATGSTSERTLREACGLGELALLDMGDFVGGTLKYLRRHPVRRLSLAGGFAKLAKLAQGHLDLHSARSRLDHPALAELAAGAGAGAELVRSIAQANTGHEMLAHAAAAGYPLGTLVAERARAMARATLGLEVELEVIVVDRAGGIVGRSGP